MLIKCPECELQVSDKAYACPHCGYPMKKPLKYRQNKRRRLPNGFGQISRINNSRLEKPYRAMVTVGKNDEGKPIVKMLKPVAYFKTYNDAYEALVKYNQDPYNIADDMLVKELYAKWVENMTASGKAKTTIRGYQTAWNYCSSISEMKVVNIRTKHLRACIEQPDISQNMKQMVKFLLNKLMDYAFQLELIPTNYSRQFTILVDKEKLNEEKRNEHFPFSKDEISALFAVSETDNIASMIIIQCFSGWRPAELVELKISDVDLDQWTIRGGKKTKAGKNRLVPVHSAIQNMIKKYYDRSVSFGSDFLFTKKRGKHFTYASYGKFFKSELKKLNISVNHTPHDPRKTFVTMAKDAGMDEYAIKHLVGHHISDLTESTYTERSLEWLSQEIEKIKAPVYE